MAYKPRKGIAGGKIILETGTAKGVGLLETADLVATQRIGIVGGKIVVEEGVHLGIVGGTVLATDLPNDAYVVKKYIINGVIYEQTGDFVTTVGGGIVGGGQTITEVPEWTSSGILAAQVATTAGTSTIYTPLVQYVEPTKQTYIVVPSRLLPANRTPGVKPLGKVEIDWTHRLTDGINVCLPLKLNGTIDLASGEKLTSVGTGGDLGIIDSSESAIGKGSITDYFTLGHGIVHGDPWTFIWRGQIGGFAETNTLCWLDLFTNFANPHSTVSIYQEDNAVSMGFNGYRLISPKATLSADTTYTVVITSSGTTHDKTEMWIDGENQTLSVESGTTNNISTNYGPLSLMVETYNNVIRPTGSTIEFIYAWQRVLSDQQIVDLSRDPYQFLKEVF